MALPVVIVASGGLSMNRLSAHGGLPVTLAAEGLAVTEGPAGYGLPVTFVTEGGSVVLPVPPVVPPLDDVEVEVVAGYSPGRSLLTSFGSGAKVTESGGVVQAWLNQKSGGVAALSQSTVAYRPTLSTAGPNNRQCLDFDGTNDCLFGSAISNYITASAGYIVISFIADVIDANNITVYANEGLMGDSGGFMGLFTKIGDALHFYNYDGTTDTVSTPITEGVPYVGEWLHEGGVGYVRINGVTQVSVASGNTSGMTGLLGVGGTSVVPDPLKSFDGKIFEMSTFKTVPTLAKRNKLVADMMNYIGAT